MKSSRVERLADRGDPAVHHVGRRDDVRAGPGMADGLLAEHLDGFIVEDVQFAAGVASDDAVVAVGVIGIERDIGDDAERRMGGLERADGPRHEAIVVVGIPRPAGS